MHKPAPLDWNDLKYFLAVSREGSTLAAAKALGVNQSTVFRRLGELERALGCAVVERHPTGYRLTDIGRQLEPFANRVEEAAAALRRQAESFDKGLTGTVRLTCSTTHAWRMSQGDFLEKFNSRYPKIRVELILTESVLHLAKGEAEIAIRGGSAGEDGLIGKKIADIPWAIFASQKYIARHGCPQTPEDIEHHSVIELVGNLAGLAAAKWLPSKAANARVAGQANSIPSLLMAIKAGVGLGPLAVPVGAAESDLIRVFGPIPELTYATMIYVHGDLRRIPRIAALFDYCAAELKPILLGKVALAGEVDGERTSSAKRDAQRRLKST